MKPVVKLSLRFYTIATLPYTKTLVRWLVSIAHSVEVFWEIVAADTPKLLREVIGCWLVWPVSLQKIYILPQFEFKAPLFFLELFHLALKQANFIKENTSHDLWSLQLFSSMHTHPTLHEAFICFSPPWLFFLLGCQSTGDNSFDFGVSEDGLKPRPRQGNFLRSFRNIDDGLGVDPLDID